MLSHSSGVRFSATPRTAAPQAPLSMRFSRQEYWSGLPCPPPGHLPDSEIKSVSPASPALSGRFFTSTATWEAFCLISFPPDVDRVSPSLYLSLCHWVISSVISSFLRQIYIKESPGHSSLMLLFPHVVLSFHLYYLFIHNISPQLECNFPVGKDCIIHYCNAWCPQKCQIHIRYSKSMF